MVGDVGTPTAVVAVPICRETGTLYIGAFTGAGLLRPDPPDPIIFNFLTIATRAYTSVSVGPDETQFMKYIARPDFVRGYDRNNVLFLTCPIIGASSWNCSATQLLGSRVPAWVKPLTALAWAAPR